MSRCVKKLEKHKAVLTDGTEIINESVDLEEAYYKNINNLLTTGEIDTNLPLGGFLNKAFKGLNKAALSEMSCSTAINTVNRWVKDTVEYNNKKQSVNIDFTEYLIAKNLFTWQKDLLTDNARKITLLCGRRSGKSYAEAGVAVKHCLSGFELINGYKIQKRVAMLGMTIGKAKAIWWSTLLKFIEDCKITPSKIDHSSLKITFQNGSTIELLGNSSRAEREKLRGGEWTLIIIDEAQSQQSLRYLMTDILAPIADARNSQFILSGTGSLTAKGYWKDVTEDSKWKHYCYTMRDNPTIENCDDVLLKVLSEHGWDSDNITYRREYLGENVVDTSRVVFSKVSYYDILDPSEIWTHAFIGIDYGFSDYNAIAVLLRNNDSKYYLAKEFKFNKSDVDTIVEKVEEAVQYCFNFKIDKRNIHLYADTSDQSISTQINKIINKDKKGADRIMIYNANKADKNLQINLLQQYLANGSLLIQKNGHFDEEIAQTIWRYDDENNQVIYEIDEVYHPDIMDAIRYALYNGINKK